MSRVVLDSGPLIALLNPNDPRHRHCRDWFASFDGEMILPAPVLTEVCWHLESWPDIEAAFVRSAARGEFTLVELDAALLERAADLVAQYRDFPLGSTDASVIAIAERFSVREIATLDHRHFRAIRPQHIEAFALVP